MASPTFSTLNLQTNTSLRATLPPPTAEEAVASAGPETDVYLLRGSRLETAKRICETGCVRADAPNPDVAAPTEDQIIKQVGGYQGGSSAEKLPEFTTSGHWAEVYATNCIIFIRIKRKYLAKGSVSECGWVCSPQAPCQLIGYLPVKPKVQTGVGGKKLNAD
jgi:hypothetical protein